MWILGLKGLTLSRIISRYGTITIRVSFFKFLLFTFHLFFICCATKAVSVYRGLLQYYHLIGDKKVYHVEKIV